MRNPTWTRDEVILATELYLRHDGDVLGPAHHEVLELSDLLRSLPIHGEAMRSEEFRNSNSIGLKLSNIRYRDPDRPGGSPHGSKLDGLLWDEFESDEEKLLNAASALRRSFASPEVQLASIEETRPDYDPPEGRVLMRLHTALERRSSTVARKIAAVRKSTGRLECEVCRFDFQQQYGDLGEGFIECHLDVPLGQLDPDAKISLRDLTVVCANCHRMLHRKGVITTAELSLLLQRARLVYPSNEMVSG